MKQKLNNIVKYMGIGIEFEVFIDDQTYEIEVIPAQIKLMKTEMKDNAKAPSYVVVADQPRKDNPTLIKEIVERE